MNTETRSDVGVAVGCLIAGTGAVAVIVAATLLEGFVLRVLWGWHLTPVVKIAAPSIAVCVGLAALASALQHPPPSEKESGGGRAMTILFVRPLLLLFIGWVAHLFASALP